MTRSRSALTLMTSGCCARYWAAIATRRHGWTRGRRSRPRSRRSSSGTRTCRWACTDGLIRRRLPRPLWLKRSLARRWSALPGAPPAGAGVEGRKGAPGCGVGVTTGRAAGAGVVAAGASVTAAGAGGGACTGALGTAGAGVAATGVATGAAAGAAGAGAAGAAIGGGVAAAGLAATGAGAAGAGADGGAATEGAAVGATAGRILAALAAASFASLSALALASASASALATPCRCARTFSATSTGIELECVFFSVTPYPAKRSIIAFALTSSSRASSLIRTWFGSVVMRS